VKHPRKPEKADDAMDLVDNVLATANWTNLVVLAPYNQWIWLLQSIWNKFSRYSPKYYEIRGTCVTDELELTRVALDFRFFRQSTKRTVIETEIKEFLTFLNFEDWFYIDPRLHKGKRAQFYAQFSGSYKKGVTCDAVHSSKFIHFLEKMSDDAIKFLAALDSMSSTHPEAQEPRSECAHLFTNMMGIQDCLIWD
jgi:hypothetical protein